MHRPAPLDQPSRMTPADMLGRVMSLVMLAMLGVTPLSTALAGAVIGLGPDVLFVAAGAGMLLVTIVAAACRRSWSIDAFQADGLPAAEAA